MTTLNTTGKIIRKKIRVGRGIGSGKGKLQAVVWKDRNPGLVLQLKVFGGQFFMRLPKRGFNSIKDLKIAKINLDKIQMFINKKKLNSNQTINVDILKKLKIINKNSRILKILGKGEIKDKVNIQADLISKSAIEKLKKIGGSIQINKK